MDTARVGVQEDRTQPGPSETPGQGMMALGVPREQKAEAARQASVRPQTPEGPSSFLDQLCRICF